MKFSEIKQEGWGELKPYLDTCILPVTGLTGLEEPWEATMALESLRDVLDLLEIPYKGRMVTYPAAHFYYEDHKFVDNISKICTNLKQVGFKYVIIVTIHETIELLQYHAVDLVIGPRWLQESSDKPIRVLITERVQQLWYGIDSSAAKVL